MKYWRRHRPRVFLERPRVVQRHLHAWLMGTFFSQLYLPGQHVGAMSAFGQMGTFCGRSLPLRWETASAPRPPLPARRWRCRRDSPSRPGGANRPSRACGVLS